MKVSNSVPLCVQWCYSRLSRNQPAHLTLYNNVQTSAVLQTPAEVAVGTGQCLLTAAAARQPRTTRRTNSVFPPPAEWCGD